MATRGVGMGQWGEGFTGTTIKDTWTKSRGKVEVGKGRENGDICNSVYSKNKVKK